MRRLRVDFRGAGIAGALLLGAPIANVALGGAFGAVHAVVGTIGLALVVGATLAKEA